MHSGKCGRLSATAAVGSTCDLSHKARLSGKTSKANPDCQGSKISEGNRFFMPKMEKKGLLKMEGCRSHVAENPSAKSGCCQ